MKQEPLPVILTAADAANSHLARFVDACHVIVRNRLALFGLMIVCMWLVTALLAPYLATHDAYEINIANRLQSPSSDHWLGTDSLGRDTYSRIVFGARTAFQVAIGAVFLGAFFGIPIGAVAGFGGRWVDAGLMLKEITPFLQLQPMAAIFPGLTISLIILGFNLLGDGLRDVFDPRQYGR